MEILVARSDIEIRQAVGRLAESAVLGCDTETSGLSARTARIFSLQISDGEFSCLVPVSEGVPLEPFGPILASPESVKVFHNAKFDLEFLSQSGVRVANVFCTMIAEKLLTRGARQSASLADTLYRYFAVDLDKAPRSKFNRRWNGVWTEELVAYALGDVVHLPRLMAEQREWLTRLGLAAEFAEQIARLTSGDRPDDLP